MKIKFILSSFLLFSLSSFSQKGITFFKVLTHPQGVMNITPIMTAQEVETAMNAVSQSVVFSIVLEDVSSSKIHVKLGTDSTGMNKYNEVLNLDGSNLPTGTTVIKNGAEVRIEIGVYAGLAHYIAEIEIESSEGVKSQKFKIKH